MNVKIRPTLGLKKREKVSKKENSRKALIDILPEGRSCVSGLNMTSCEGKLALYMSIERSEQHTVLGIFSIGGEREIVIPQMDLRIQVSMLESGIEYLGASEPRTLFSSAIRKSSIEV